MSLLAGVNYYFISEDDLNTIDSYDDTALVEAGLTITSSQIDEIVERFRKGVNVDGNWYLGEDRITVAEYDFLYETGFLGIQPAMESSQLPGHA